MKTYEVTAKVTVEYEVVFNVTADDPKQARIKIENHGLSTYGGHLIEIDSRHLPDCHSDERLGVEHVSVDEMDSSIDDISVTELDEEENENE